MSFSSSSSSSVVFEGWVQKAGEHKIQKHRRRWLVLYKDKRVKYYTDDKSTEIKGSIDLTSANWVGVSKTGGTSKFKFGFKISTISPKRDWRFFTQTEEERMQWIQHLQVVSKFNDKILNAVEKENQELQVKNNQQAEQIAELLVKLNELEENQNQNSQQSGSESESGSDGELQMVKKQNQELNEKLQHVSASNKKELAAKIDLVNTLTMNLQKMNIEYDRLDEELNQKNELVEQLENDSSTAKEELQMAFETRLANEKQVLVKEHEKQLQSLSNEIQILQQELDNNLKKMKLLEQKPININSNEMVKDGDAHGDAGGTNTNKTPMNPSLFACWTPSWLNAMSRVFS